MRVLIINSRSEAGFGPRAKNAASEQASRPASVANLMEGYIASLIQACPANVRPGIARPVCGPFSLRAEFPDVVKGFVEARF